jgi:hypothetical protein
MNSVSNSFAESFVWRQRNLILPVALYAPLAYEVGKIAYKAIKNPEAISEKAREFKKVLIDSCTARDGESPEEFRKRLIINVLKVLGGALLLASACAFPLLFLPAGFALPVALIAVGLSILLIKNGERIAKSIPEIKSALIDAFTRRKGETEEAAQGRIATNVGKALLAALAITAIALVAAYLIPFIVQTLAAMSLSPWNILSALPGQSTLVVFLEYAAVGAMHLILAARAFYRKEWATGAMHLLNGILSFVFPLQDLLVNGASNVRLHHSFTGLLLQLMPLDALKIFGGMITFDSSLYWFSPFRGYLDPYKPSKNKLVQFDFMDIFIENWQALVATLTAASVVQVLADDFFSDDKKSRTKKAAEAQIV